MQQYGARVIPFPPPRDPGTADVQTSGRQPARVYDTSFEVTLDDDPEPDATRPPVYVDVVTREHELRPIVPAALRRGNLGPTVRHAAGRTGHRFGYHAARAPLYLALAAVWAPTGVARIVVRQLRWWWVVEQHGLRQQAATDNDPLTWHKLHREAKSTRLFRGWVLAAELVGLAAAAAVLFGRAPGWAPWAVLAVLVPLLAHVGRPVDRPIVRPAVVTPRFRKLTSDIVLRAYYAAGLGNPDKPGQQIAFGSTMARDGEGSRVLVDLPYGKGFDDAVKARTAIASGLDVTVNQVFLTRDPSSHRRHVLWVADRDPLAVPAGGTPLLDCRPRDIWAPAPFGLDERGAKVAIALMWISVLVGAQPRKGKTFSARLLALYAALDPWVKLIVVDGKNSPDWRKFALVADQIIFGTHPSRDGDPVEQLLITLRGIKAHILKVNEVLSGLPVDQCPEGKLTPELARDPRYPDLRVWFLIMEEFQVYYELDDKDATSEIASLLSFIMAVGPSAGVILISSTQKPSGIGAGQTVQQLFNRFRDNHTARFALKCGNRNVSEAILGSDAYSEGIDASGLPTGLEYRGVGYLYGLTDHTPTVRTYLADHQDAEKILLAARAHRQRAGTLSGMAAGQDIAVDLRDVLADARGVFHAGEARISWPELAARLREQQPGVYAELTAEAISAQLRGLGVPSKSVKDREHFPSGTGQGFDRAALEQAITRRQLTDGR